MLPEEQWLDKFTRTDELIIELTQAVERLVGEKIEPPFVPIGDTEALIRRLVELEELYLEREVEIKFFTYPDTGLAITLQPGTTKIDFWNGKVTDVDGNITDLSHSLQSDGKEWLRSIFIDTDQDILVSLDGSDWIPAKEQRDFQAPYMQFRTIEIVTTVATTFFMLVCTNPLAILSLRDKPSSIAGAPRLMDADKMDLDGTLNYFETDQPIGTTPSLYLVPVPASTTKFVIESVRYYMASANNRTYELYLLEASNADDIENLGDVVFDSDALQADATAYTVIGGDASGKLPMHVNLKDAGKLYYMIDWSDTPGNTKGYIKVRGRVKS